MELFEMRKNLRKKNLIWHMLGEMVEKQGKARLHISYNYSCTLYFLVKILLVKLKNFHTLTCLKCEIITQENINQKCNGCKDDGIYQNL